MKRNLKRLPAMLLSVILCLSLLPVTAGAAAATTVMVNGVDLVTDEYHTVTCGNGTAKYDSESNTLTLKGGAISSGHEITVNNDSVTCGIYVEGDLNLVLEESNIVENTNNPFDIGVYVEGDLTVSGTGTLTTAGADAGIRAGKSMTVENGTVTGTSSDNNRYGIYVVDTLTVSGGSVTGTGTGSYSYGIGVNDTMTVTGGTVEGTSTGSNNGCGIVVFDDALTVSGGSVTGEGATYGIRVDYLTVSGSGSVTGTGSSGEGIFIEYRLRVSGSGSVTGEGADYGVDVDGGTLTVSGSGSVSGTADGENGDGIYTKYTLTVNDSGTVTGTATAEGGWGINVNSGALDVNSWGIDAAPLNVTGGIVTGKGTNAAIVAYKQGSLAAGNLISVPANYVPSGYETQAVIVQNSTYASFAETGKELTYDSEAGTFTNAATEITLKAPGAVPFPRQFYGSINFDPSYGYKSFGHVTQSGDSLTYTETGDVTGRTIYGMESAGGAIFTVESDDNSEWMLRVYSSDLATFRTIGRVTNQAGDVDYAIVDTAMDLSGAEPVLYGTYQALGLVGSQPAVCSYICQIDLTSGKTSNYLQVTGLSSTKDIVYAMAFGGDGKLYAIGADMGDYGGPATLYTIDKARGTATKVGEIKDSSGNTISTNYTQDLAYDYNTGTLYWMENAKEVLYTVDAASAVATKVGQVKHSDPPYYLPQAYSLTAFCILDGVPAISGGKHMVSVIHDENVTVTQQDDSSPTAAVYMLDSDGSLALNITPHADLGLWYVKVDGQEIGITDPTQSITQTIQVDGNDHVIEVSSRLPNPVTKNDEAWDWFHYQGKTASFYTQHDVYKFYEWDRFDPEFDAPTTGYTQTLLDEEGADINGDTVLLPGLYGVRVTHPGTEKYAPLTLQYENALDLAKCDGTPGRPVVYGKVGCTQGDLATTSYLQDWYYDSGELTGTEVYDQIPVTLVWQSPETTYNEEGYFSASATIYAGDLSEHIRACYNHDDGTPLNGCDQISSRSTQVIVLPADEASLIKLQASDADGGTVSGKGVYKNNTQVTVTATPNTNAGYVFLGWQENGQTISGAGATYTFTASVDRTLTAVFVKDPEYLVRLQVDGEEGCGTVTGGGNYKEDEHSATVTATANPGYYFIGWYEGDTQKSTETSYTFPVPQAGITLTAKFGVDYLTKAEQAKETFEKAQGEDSLTWAILTAAVDAYNATADFVKNPPSGITNAGERYTALTTYYNGVKKLDLSNQGISSADLAKLALFTGVTDLNLSGNKGVTDLTALKDLTQLETLDISNTGVTTADVLVSGDALVFPGLKTLTAKNLSLTSISALAELVGAEGFNTDAITKWDFSSSTLTDTEGNKADVEAIKNKLGDKFLPPTLQIQPTGGGGGGGGVSTYAISLPTGVTNGTVTVSPKRAAKGATVIITVTPDEGYELDKLTVTDSSGNTVEVADKGDGTYTFTMPPSAITVNASFAKIVCDGGVDCPAYSYRDVDTSAWYHEAVDYVLVNGLMSGYGNGVFGPNDHLSRAQLCQILYNKEGRPAVTGSSVFTDVADSAWYADAVTWAASQGIVGGYGGGLFGPEDNITREQLAAILYRYAQTKGYDVSVGEDTNILSYTDALEISEYAIPSMQWACGAGIINGTGDGSTLSPQGQATRAQIATMLMRFCGYYADGE